MAAFEMSEFLQEQTKPEEATAIASEKVEVTVEAEKIDAEADMMTPGVELDVQKQVVEELAADKAERDEIISNLRKENYAQKSKIYALEDKLAEMKTALENVGDVLAKNSEAPLSSQVALLDRNSQMVDHFEGETRDQVIEVIKEARDRAEADGRNRRAQILEAVLVENQGSGNLQRERDGLKKFFIENGNILSGPVIEELNKRGISYKNGEEYLLAEEILKRTY